MHTAPNNTLYNDYVMRPRSYSRGLRNRKTYANANANGVCFISATLSNFNCMYVQCMYVCVYVCMYVCMYVVVQDKSASYLTI